MPNAWLGRQSCEWWFTPQVERELTNIVDCPPTSTATTSSCNAALWIYYTHRKEYRDIPIGKRLKLHNVQGKRLCYRVSALIGPVGPGIAVLARPCCDLSLPPAAILYISPQVTVNGNLEEIFRAAVEEALAVQVSEPL